MLRKDKDNPNKVAQIYDMIVLPQHTTNLSKTVQNLILKELRRFTEFAKLSKNFHDALNQIEKLKKNMNWNRKLYEKNQVISDITNKFEQMPKDIQDLCQRNFKKEQDDPFGMSKEDVVKIISESVDQS